MDRRTDSVSLVAWFGSGPGAGGGYSILLWLKRVQGTKNTQCWPEIEPAAAGLGIWPVGVEERREGGSLDGPGRLVATIGR